MSLSYITMVDWPANAKKVQMDPKLQPILQYILKGGETHPTWPLVRGHLRYRDHVVLSSTSKYKTPIMEEFHASPTGGHGGFLKTFKRISAELFWVGMKGDVKNLVATCATCQQNKYETLSPTGLLQPLTIPHAIREDVFMDFIEGLPRSQVFDSIMVVVDKLSKYGHFMALKHPFSAKTVAEEFIRQTVRLHRLPRSIVSDRDRIFMSNFWRE